MESETANRQKQIGARIEQARKSVGLLRQRELAQALGVTSQWISNWETGRKPISTERAAQIEHLCNADAGFILDDVGQLWGGSPRFNPPSAGEIDLLRRVDDLERELSALRAALLALAGDRSATPDDIQAAMDSGRRVAERVGRASRSEESQQG